jgi:cardiolipin synthase
LVLAALVLADEGFGFGLDDLRTVLIFLTAVLTAASLAVYVRTWVAHIAGDIR